MAKKENGPLGEVVKKIVSVLEKKGPFTEEEMARAWAEVVGEKAAAHARPVSLRGSTLAVNCDASAWLYELSTKKREILKGLAGHFKGRRLKDIRFRIGEVKAQAKWRKAIVG